MVVGKRVPWSSSGEEAQVQGGSCGGYFWCASTPPSVGGATTPDPGRRKGTRCRGRCRGRRRKRRADLVVAAPATAPLRGARQVRWRRSSAGYRTRRSVVWPSCRAHVRVWPACAGITVGVFFFFFTVGSELYGRILSG
uniref:Uncharacterized protein n=1 Tax=Arundo donax TaxID=35708 RepID=A0A0A8XY32_ARUDO